MGIGSIIVRSLVGEITKEIRAASREAARVDRLKQRLQNLGRIHVLIINDFITPLCADLEKISPKDLQVTNRYLCQMNERGDEILKNPSVTGDSHVTRYATSVKKAAMIAITLCKKYNIYSDIQSVTYDASRKMIILNGQDHYCLE